MVEKIINLLFLTTLISLALMGAILLVFTPIAVVIKVGLMIPLLMILASLIVAAGRMIRS